MTAECVGRALVLPVQPDDRLREHYLGEFQGLTHAEIREKFPERVAQIGATDQWVPVPGEEPVADFMARVRHGCDDIVAWHCGQTVIIVSHGGTISRALLAWLGMDARRHPPFHLDNTSITRVIFDGALYQIRALNDTLHLLNGARPCGAETHW